MKWYFYATNNPEECVKYLNLLLEIGFNSNDIKLGNSGIYYLATYRVLQ